MKATKTDRILKKHGIQPCAVKLNKNIFKKIKMKCTAFEDGVKVTCKLTQTGTNTFEIKVKRNKRSISVVEGLY